MNTFILYEKYESDVAFGTPYGDIATLKVGSKGAVFHVHKGILCNASSYFKAALGGQFKEAINQAVVLDDEDPEMFQRFNTWLYTGRVIEKDEKITDVDHTALFKLHVFADERGISRLLNPTMDAILQEENNYPSNTKAKSFVWANTNKSSPLRRALLELSLADSTWYDGEDIDRLTEEEKESLKWPETYFLSLLHLFSESLISKVNRINVANPAHQCRYHVHEGEPRCGEIDETLLHLNWHDEQEE